MASLRISDLWRLDGTLPRGPYAVWGAVLVGLKYNLDRVVAAAAFHRTWSIFSYLAPQGSGRVDALRGDDLRFFGLLLLLAVPFIYSGVALTLRRLRDSALPVMLVWLFFVPLLNLLFFALLCLLPTANAAAAAPVSTGGGSLGQRVLDRIIPRGALASAAMALLLVLPTAVLLTLLSIHALKNYGWGLFVGLPFMIGLAAALLHGYHQPRSLGGCLSVAVSAVSLLGLCLLVFAIEGAFCLVMAWPLGAALAALGGGVGYLVQRRPSGAGAPQGAALALLLCLLPAMMGAERVAGGSAALIPVRTTIEVNAPPSQVWRHVVSFSELPPPEQWLFRIGIAYPQRAEISGSGAGAVRRCVFSTGAFVEPIQIWEEPRLLRFSVAAQPPAMKEMTPWGKINAPHVSDFLVSEGGQFRLTELEGGRTLLEGTTWYRHRIWPADYWRLWSDWILHSIHQRVLDHIKRETERGA